MARINGHQTAPRRATVPAHGVVGHVTARRCDDLSIRTAHGKAYHGLGHPNDHAARIRFDAIALHAGLHVLDDALGQFLLADDGIAFRKLARVLVGGMREHRLGRSLEDVPPVNAEIALGQDCLRLGDALIGNHAQGEVSVLLEPCEDRVPAERVDVVDAEHTSAIDRALHGPAPHNHLVNALLKPLLFRRAAIPAHALPPYRGGKLRQGR